MMRLRGVRMSLLSDEVARSAVRSVIMRPGRYHFET
jgi:hypothetical protein